MESASGCAEEVLVFFLMAAFEKKERLLLSKGAFVFGALCRARGKVCPFQNLKRESL